MQFHNRTVYPYGRMIVLTRIYMTDSSVGHVIIYDLVNKWFDLIFDCFIVLFIY